MAYEVAYTHLGCKVEHAVALCDGRRVDEIVLSCEETDNEVNNSRIMRSDKRTDNGARDSSVCAKS